MIGRMDSVKLAREIDCFVQSYGAAAGDETRCQVSIGADM